MLKMSIVFLMKIWGRSSCPQFKDENEDRRTVPVSSKWEGNNE